MNEPSATAVTPILYTQTGCAESAKVRAWLSDRGIAFTEHNVSGDPIAARALYDTGVFATPLLAVGSQRVVGFRPRSLAALIGGRR